MWCPNCGSEYRRGYTHCSDCGHALVHEPPEVPEPETQSSPPFDPHSIGPELVEVGSCSGRFAGEMIRSLLRGSGIESVLTGEGTTLGVTHPMTVGPMSTVKVLVRLEDGERARELFLAVDAGEPADEEIGEGDL